MRWFYILALSLPFVLAMQSASEETESLICRCASADYDMLESAVSEAQNDAEISPVDRSRGIYRIQASASTSRSEKSGIRTLLGNDTRRPFDCYPDRRVELRVTPNDPLYGEQWGLQRIMAESAWQLGSTPVTALGDTIVIAILDAGYNTDHEDLIGTTWENHAEIPNDLIDNDGNGYVDDHRGLNIQSGNDNHSVHYHGAGVSGIIGANGNNGVGIAGVNWQVKLLLVSGIERESDIIEGYAYIRELRKKYNDTNGAAGAFIVASNLSAGINGEWGEDHPLWCGAYDDMGAEGILSIASTTNSSVNVDEEGDMPSTCGSDYLIVVTNTTIDDVKMNPAGYGVEHVDLGAPGTTTTTTGLENEYQEFPGTSAAAPHVTGVVGLLSGLPCEALALQLIANPGPTALSMRQSILTGVDRNDDLIKYTASGGRLNAASTAKDFLRSVSCDSSIFANELVIQSASPNPTIGEVMFIYDVPSVEPFTWTVIDAMGRITQSESVVPERGLGSLHYIDFDNYVSGVYFVMVEGAGYRTTSRIVVP